MKKLFFIVSLLALSLGCLTSCNDSENLRLTTNGTLTFPILCCMLPVRKERICWMPVLPEIFLKTISG